ncbi:hypothetical protein LPJ77_001976 [Coemansia sp. RSA 2523]|nr:hypothetical protein LPJ54_001495 [Coemansia sp. RSA 1824]KAJ1808975.1 hypothetical protein LPJ77_001976 [Coemansia sp. RSA 2523]
MHRTTKPETSRSMSSVPYHQSPSLVSLPMLPRPSTAAMASSLALSGVQFDSQKRQRLNSKAGALGSLFRTKAHSKRGSTAGSDTMSPVLEPQDVGDAAWGVGIDYPTAVSPLFSDESLQQLLGSSPQFPAQMPRRPSSPSLSGLPALPESELMDGGPMSPASVSSRRSKREIAASVLHNSAGPFRRLRSGPASKTMSFPPATMENTLYRNVASDEFVVVTPDMCPPASLVSSSVISGVSPLEASVAQATASTAALPVLTEDEDHGRGTNNRGITPRRNQPRTRGALELRARALTQVSKSSEHLLLMRYGSYEDSTDSLVRVSTPSLSASSSEASLPLSQVRKKAPAPLAALSQPRAQSAQRQVQGSALGSGLKPPAQRNMCVLSPAPKGRAGSPRRVSECSFSSTEEQRRRLSPFVQLDTLSPYTMDRLSSTAASATERRRRSPVHRTRRSRTSSTSSANWGLSATSEMTLLAESARAHHARNLSDASDYADDQATPEFDFQIQSAESETFWPDESPLASDADELEQQIAASGFPSSCSAQFNFEVGRDTEPTCESPRQRSQSSGAAGARGTDEIRSIREQAFPRAIASLLDPSSPMGEEVERSMGLNMLAHPRRMRAHTSAILETTREYDEGELSPTIPDHYDFEFDGSTLTQQNDWQLMNPSSSDGEQPPQMHSLPRRRVRKRRVLPKSMFMVSPKHNAIANIVADDALYGESKSSDTLHPGPDEGCDVALEAPCETQVLMAKNDEHCGAPPLAADVATAKHGHGEVSETGVVAIVAPPDMRQLLSMEHIPRMPASIERDMRIGHVARLTLISSGDPGSWQPTRIASFGLRLFACIERAHGMRDLALVNLGLTGIPRGVLRCAGLHRLNMAHNWIDTVPGWLAQLPHLAHISLAGNPLRIVSADLVEMRQRLATLDFGSARNWALLNRRPAPPPRLSPDEQKRVLVRRLQVTAAKRMSAAIGSACLSVTQRQHEATLDRATRMLSVYSNALYSTLREPRSWGHSVALPFPTHSSFS